MSSKLRRVLLAVVIAGVLPACGNINDGHPPVPFTVLASVHTDGTLANQDSGQPVLSGDGRYLVFTSASDKLVDNDDNGAFDVFRRDLKTGVTELVSVGDGGVPADGDSFRPSVSFDGRWIAFESGATNLTSVAPGFQQVYLRDMNAPAGSGIVMVSEAAPGTPGNGISQHASISADGRYVAFSSKAVNFGDAPANAVPIIYRRDMNGSTILRVSENFSHGEPTPPALPTKKGSVTPSISADGSRVAYTSDCTDIVTPDGNNKNDVFVAKIGTPIETVMASPSFFGGGGFGNSESPAISGDGLFVAFHSTANDLIDPDTNDSASDVFLFDVENQIVQIVSVNAAGFQGTVVEESFNPSISFDGQLVAFDSGASNMVAGDTNQASDIFIKDMRTGMVTRVSVDTSGQQGAPNLNSYTPSLSSDGRSVAFVTEAAFVNADANGLPDIYVRSPLR